MEISVGRLPLAPPQILGDNVYAVLLNPRPAMLLTVTRLTFYSAKRKRERRKGALKIPSADEFFFFVGKLIASLNSNYSKVVLERTISH